MFFTRIVTLADSCVSEQSGANIHGNIFTTVAVTLVLSHIITSVRWGLCKGWSDLTVNTFNMRVRRKSLTLTKVWISLGFESFTVKSRWISEAKHKFYFSETEVTAVRLALVQPGNFSGRCTNLRNIFWKCSWIIWNIQTDTLIILTLSSLTGTTFGGIINLL